MNFFEGRAPTFSEQLVICETISDIEGFRGLELKWNDLLAKSSATSFFLTYEYLWTWWNVYGAAYKLRIIAARNVDGELIGLAPMMIGAGESARRRLLRHLVFIGGLGDTISEDQDFIVAAGYEDAVIAPMVQVLMEQLAGEWDLMQLGMVSSESPCLAPLGGAIARASGKLRCVERSVAPYASLPATWEAYFAARSTKFRTDFKSHSRKLKRNHRVEFLTAGREISAAEAISVVATLSRDRWGSASNAFNSEKYVEFHSRLAELLVPQKQAHVAVMKVDGKGAAAQYVLIYGPKMFGFAGFWDRSLARLSIGKIMLGELIQWAINEGLTEFDFLSGADGYKSKWTTGRRELLDLEVVNPKSFPGRAFEKIRQLRTKLREAFSSA